MMKDINVICISSGEIYFYPRKKVPKGQNYVLVKPERIKTIKGIENDWGSRPKVISKRYVRKG